MNKEQRNEFKWLKKIPCVFDLQNVPSGNHLKWKWKMKNKHGWENAQVTLPNSPSCPRWKMNHRRNVRKIFQDLGIEGYRIQLNSNKVIRDSDENKRK